MVELQSFFDKYLKTIENDWEKTPKVRWSALQFGDQDAMDDIILEDFPVPNTDYKEFFLQDNELQQASSRDHKIFSYDSENHKDFVEFNHTFEQPSRLIGLPKAVLYVSCDDRDDFVVFIVLRKKDKHGKDLMHLNSPIKAAPVNSISEIPEKEQASTNLHLGSVGVLRGSQRAIDHSRDLHPQFPFHPYTKQEKVSPETIVKLEIGIWAMGVDFDAGESISVRVSLPQFPLASVLDVDMFQVTGQYPSIQEFKSFSGPRPQHELNKGKHHLHCCGDYPSSIILPFIDGP